MHNRRAVRLIGEPFNDRTTEVQFPKGRWQRVQYTDGTQTVVRVSELYDPTEPDVQTISQRSADHV